MGVDLSGQVKGGFADPGGNQKQDESSQNE
jgi:hypothetical protein